MPQLRDGTRSEDGRLDRLVQFDERSRSFPVRPLTTQTPKTKTWRLRDRHNQGHEGACVGFAFTHEINAKPIQQRVGIGARFAREEVYWEAQKIDPWPGGEYPGASPHMEGTSILAGVKILQQRGFITEYRWGFGLDDLIYAVSDVGPAVAGTFWKTGMWNTDDRGYIHATGRNEGGHAYLVRGVLPRQERFTITNSWGRTWGRSGDAYISFEDMEKLLHEQGEVCVPVERAVAPR